MTASRSDDRRLDAAGVYMLLEHSRRYFYVGSSMNLRERERYWMSGGVYDANKRFSDLFDALPTYDWSFFVIESLPGAPEAYVRAAEARHIRRALNSDRCLNVSPHARVSRFRRKPPPSVTFLPRGGDLPPRNRVGWPWQRASEAGPRAVFAPLGSGVNDDRLARLFGRRATK